MPIEFSPCATNPCVAAEPWTRHDQALHNKYPSQASRPNRGRVRAHTRPDQSRAPRTTKESTHPCRVPRTAEPRARLSHASRTAGLCIRPTCAFDRSYARIHSAVHTLDHSAEYTHSLAQVTLNLLCSTHSDMNNVLCFWLYTSGVTFGLTMLDISQFLFFLIFSSNFILT